MVDTIEAIRAFLQSYPVWVRVLFVIWLIFTVVGLLVLIFIPRLDRAVDTESEPLSHNDGSSSAPANTESLWLPDEKIERTLPQPLIFADSVDELRGETNVRALRNIENELPLTSLVNGTMGYAEAHDLNTPAISMVGDYRTLRLDTTIRQSRRYPTDVEVHKASNGIAYVIVCVTDETRLQLECDYRSDSLSTVVTLRRYDAFIELVAIPQGRLLFWNYRTFADGEPAADCRIT